MKSGRRTAIPAGVSVGVGSPQQFEGIRALCAPSTAAQNSNPAAAGLHVLEDYSATLVLSQRFVEKLPVSALELIYEAEDLEPANCLRAPLAKRDGAARLVRPHA
jgi:hypothetical protein